MLLGFINFLAFSQDLEHAGGGRFLKRVEHNLLLNVLYNLDSKGDVEKLLLGDFNARVEFFYAPSHDGASAFRVVRDSLNKSWCLEIKHVSNYVEAQKISSYNNPSIGIPANLMSSLPNDIRHLIKVHNNNITDKYFEEMHKLFKVETHSFPISDQFMEKLYGTMVSLIENIKAIGLPEVCFGGYSVSFRTVVDIEVWSLNVQMPQGNALKMSNLCRQIITDAMANEFDEAKYISVLDSFENYRQEKLP